MTTVAAGLGVFLWSARSQRMVKLRVAGVGPLDPEDPAVLHFGKARKTENNSVEILQDGPGLFGPLFRAIGQAENHVHLSLYLWGKGEVCRRLADVLAARAAAGVEVRLLLDAMGAWDADEELFEKIRAAGGKVAFYHGFRFRTLGRLNSRSHRRIVVVDGREGFVFGHGIAEEWDGEEGWRDTGLRIRGPAVLDLQGAFIEQWAEVTTAALVGRRYFPPAEAAGDVALEVVATAPRGGISHMSLYLQMRIAAAREEIWIQMPYFIPGPRFCDLLEEVLARGCRIHLMVPGDGIDWKLLRRAARRTFSLLLAAGMEICELSERMMHQKVIVVDRRWCFVGTPNLDDRSLEINAEVGIGMWSEERANELVDAFRRDQENCIELDAESLARLSAWSRILDAISYWLRQQI